MTNLSQSAQAVLDAVEDDCIHPVDRHRIAAAALRAVTDQVVPVGPAPGAASLKEFERWYVKRFVRMQLLAIADELEAQ